MTLQRTNAPSDLDLQEIQAITGVTLSYDYKRTYRSCSGLKADDGVGPEVQVTFPDGFKCPAHVRLFYSVEEIRTCWKYVGPVALNEEAERFDLNEEFVEPEYLVPIAGEYDGGAIYIAVGGRHAGKVFLMDNGDFGIGWVADNVDEFLRQIVG